MLHEATTARQRCTTKTSTSTSPRSRRAVSPRPPPQPSRPPRGVGVKITGVSQDGYTIRARSLDLAQGRVPPGRAAPAFLGAQAQARPARGGQRPVYQVRGGAAWRVLPHDFPRGRRCTASSIGRASTRCVGAGSRHAAGADPSAGGSRSRAECRHHRQPDLEDHGKRGAVKRLLLAPAR